MSTNYYAKAGFYSNLLGEEQKLHIGKSSVGWCFSLHVIPALGINTLEDWKRVLVSRRIVDEYGSEITLKEMFEVITERRWDSNKRSVGPGTPYNDLADFYERNHAEEGPNGLLRHRIEEGHCVGHGDGTWDLIANEFS